MEEFYRHMKLKAHFWDTHKKQTYLMKNTDLKAKSINAGFLQKQIIQQTYLLKEEKRY